LIFPRGKNIKILAVAMHLTKHCALILAVEKYGTIVKIGTGQKVARKFLKAGATVGTIANTHRSEID